MTEISRMITPNILQNLACLIQEAWDAKDEAIQAMCWHSYIVEFDKKIIEFAIEYKVYCRIQ